MSEWDWSKQYKDAGKAIPMRMMPALQRYVELGNIPGDFLKSVICNDLKGAVAHADGENLECLPVYVRFLYNQCPSDCWGSKAKMKEWHDRGRLLRI